MRLKIRFRKEKPKPGPENFIGLQRVREEREGVELRYYNGLVRIQALCSNIIRLGLRKEFSASEEISEAVILKPGAKYHLERTPEQLAFSTEQLKLLIPEGAFRFEIYAGSEKLLSRDFPGLGPMLSGENFEVYRYIFPNEIFYGLGDKYGGLVRRKKFFRFWSQDLGSSRFDKDPRYSALPFLICYRSGIYYGWFIDYAGYLEINTGKKYPFLLRFKGKGSSANLYFLYGPSLKELVMAFTELVGRGFLPPVWALGYHQSRYSYFSQKEVEEIAEEFKKRDLPLSAIHLDIHYMDKFKPFTIDKKRFPALKKLSEKLGQESIRLVSIIDPGLKADKNYSPYLEAKEKGYLCEDEKGKEYQGRLWPGGCALPDFFRKEVQEFWAEQHKNLFEQGISGIWNDMNEPSLWRYDLRMGKLVIPLKKQKAPKIVHKIGEQRISHRRLRNLYGQKQCQATELAFKKFLPNKRPFILTRSGFAGIQRLSAIWTGDSQSRFEHLEQSIPQLLSFGLSGVSFAGADIGGFAKNCSKELYARWIQIGAFYPFCRTHSGIRTRAQEPYQFGAEVEKIAKEYIRLRYRLLPYIYSFFWQSHKTGLPLWRPLMMEFADDHTARMIEDQIMFGEFLMLAPVVKPKIKERRVYLPKGNWIDFWEKKVFSGPAWIELKAPLERMPILVQEGAILAFQKSANLKIPWETLELEVYPGDTQSVFQLYEDDGESEDYLDGKFSIREFSLEKKSEGLKLLISERRGEFSIPRRNVILKFYLLNSKPKVYLDDKVVEDFIWQEDKNMVELAMVLDELAHQIELIYH